MAERCRRLCALKRQNSRHKPSDGTLARNSPTADLAARAQGRDLAAERGAVFREDDLARDDLDALAASEKRPGRPQEGPTGAGLGTGETLKAVGIRLMLS